MRENQTPINTYRQEEGPTQQTLQVIDDRLEASLSDVLRSFFLMNRM
ncbi:hypothetical protein ACEQPO_04980 [Bacillus sp. SL00103]